MKTIKLYGHLGKKFGKIHKFEVKTPAEAIRALKANIPEFTAYVVKHNLPGYKILVGEDNRSDPEMLHYPADSNNIKIIPVIQGSGGDWGMIIIGVVMIAAAVAMPYAAAAIAQSGSFFAAAGGTITAAASAATTLTTVAGMASTALMTVGAALTLGGVSSLLFSPSAPTATQSSSFDQISSSHFNGPINLAQQGNPIPIAYGRIRIGSQVISAGITTIRA